MKIFVSNLVPRLEFVQLNDFKHPFVSEQWDFNKFFFVDIRMKKHLLYTELK